MPETDLSTEKGVSKEIRAKRAEHAAWELNQKADGSGAAANAQVPNGDPANVDPEVAKCLATRAQGKESLDMVQQKDGSWKWVQTGEVKGCGADVDMTLELVKAICIQEKLYREPENNDKLQLPLKGFTKIQNLEPYVNIKALFLQGNGIKVIEGLSHMKQLKTLNLDNNMIEHITGLSDLKELGTLQLSGNRISKIENLSDCSSLENLQMARNTFLAPDAIAHLADLPQLKVLDIQSNRIETGGQEFLEFIKKTKLQCVYFMDIPCISEIKCPRKAFLGSVPTLQFFNDAPVDEIKQERRLCEAWVKGGPDAETAERTKVQAEKKKKSLVRPGQKKKDDEVLQKEVAFKKKIAEATGVEVGENPDDGSAVNCVVC